MQLQKGTRLHLRSLLQIVKGLLEEKLLREPDFYQGNCMKFPYSVTDKFGTITKKASYTAPAAPVDVVVNKLKNLVFTLVQQNKNQFKVEASYQLVYSDGTIEAKKHYLDGNFGNPSKVKKQKSLNKKLGYWRLHLQDNCTLQC